DLGFARILYGQPDSNAIFVPRESRSSNGELLRHAKCIGLPKLLDYCFSLGIAVIYLDQFPANTKKPVASNDGCHQANSGQFAT
ncbi:MAG: hypothetical protein RL748_4332, partial [Pseudomonadota bacterium]